MTVQEFTDFFDACKGKDLAGIRLNANRLNADCIKGLALAFACARTPESVSDAVFAYLCDTSFVLHRGTKVWLDGYPYIVTTDIPIPTDTEVARTTQIPCTTIIAYGDRREEEEYKVVLSYGDINI